MTEQSNAESEAMQMVKVPRGWNIPNPEHTAYPFAYFNSYTNPAFLNGQVGGGSAFPRSDQFSSSLTQPVGRPALGYESRNSTLAQSGHGAIGHAQSGAGIVDVIKGAYHGARKHKVISRALHAASHFKPGLKKYANAAESIGFGRFDRPVGTIGDMARPVPNYSLMPVKQRFNKY